MDFRPAYRLRWTWLPMQAHMVAVQAFRVQLVQTSPAGSSSASQCDVHACDTYQSTKSLSTPVTGPLHEWHWRF
jgi:hypothetical protein